MESGVFWLSSSGAEISRARNVLKALTPSGVIDELGFLVLQGAFADHFYPAVTTPMTRVRYLIFVPAIYQYLERSGKAVGKDVEKLAGDLQYNLLESLGNADGAIGKTSRRNIVRPPSEIYWNALAALGLATQHISLTTYHRQLAAGAFKPQILRDDDDAAHPGDVESLWDAALRVPYVMPDGVFPTETTFHLPLLEAKLLQARYAGLKPAGQDSLITHMVSLAVRSGLPSFEEIEHLWDIPDLHGESAVAVEHARLLSLFARGTTLQYYRLLIEKKGEEDVGAAEAFEAWWNKAREDLARWDVEAFFALIQIWGADRRPVYDREFIKGWVARCVAGRTSQKVLDDLESRRIIGQREDRVRPGKQRLRIPHHLNTWQQPDGYDHDDIYQLGYRHSVGRQFAQDIADGLRRGAA